MVDSKVLQSIPANQAGGKPLNLARQLEAALPPATNALLKAVTAAAEAHRSPIYLVGGFVRDLLLQRPSLDLDLVVEGDAIPLARRLAKQYGGAVTAYAQFGTATWTIRKAKKKLAGQLFTDGRLAPDDLPDALDLASARRERYAHSGALPEVDRDGIQADTYRRDVTVNTLALRLDGEHYGELVDHWGGLEDLRQGRLRVLHDGSFADDATRILRVLRFAARFDFRIEPHTLDLLKAAKSHLQDISGERLRHELDLILAEAHRATILKELQDYGILAAIHPMLRVDKAALARLERQPATLPKVWELDEEAANTDLAYLLWLVYLSREEVASLATRLPFTRRLLAALEALVDLQGDAADLVGAAPSQVVTRLEAAPLMAVFAQVLITEKAKLRAQLEAFAQNWRQVQPTVTGDDLKRRGLPPGPRYGEILWRLRVAWLDGEVKSQAEEAAYLEQLLNEGD